MLSPLFQSLPLLSLLIWAPILGGIFVLMLGERQQEAARLFALVVSILIFLLSAWLCYLFDNTATLMQFVEHTVWIDTFNINYHLGVDGISVPLILLTTFTTALVVIACWTVIQTRVTQYLAAFLILEGLMIGVFTALDAILFYFFWEAMLIPMFLIIGVWGGPRRIYATIKFFLYTFLGSVFMLVALLYMYSKIGSFYLFDLYRLPLSLAEQQWIFIAFLLAFAVKIPMWPVHTWLPDAHVEAPTGGSVILAAILLKMGGYGFIRFSLPITPDASAAMAGFMIVLSLIAIVYIGFVALAQQDMKKLIAYSSVSHMGFVTLGFFIMFSILEQAGSNTDAAMGLAGAMMQMISHGLISAALFLCVGVMYDRVHSRQIADYGGVANTMPVFASFMMLFAMANAGLPGTSGFIGEFMVILSSFKANAWVAVLAATVLILGAAYTLWMYKRVIFGDVANEQVAALQDVSLREVSFLLLLAVPVLLLGLWPAPLFELMDVTLRHLVEHIAQSKIN
ncbi:MAG: NADH-quinone oxidoreductase subunit M [Gammaproteobacteria bacterium]|nr:NADH-quinone oxidoreductase subunit M [Gammaproteobacteria bacterium]MCY4211575.1 NADH-quinone oxidoreductase subunit M [Gammaproteobacteria bacterium]MCY4281822.1 NADH-quinone oxidoreductase subunit M [Gammaproteobacteria bacterium]MCY4338738.1 NADH-quinone oxidoreductase subunit M [Gammaproteobacteria bacterium]